MISMSSNGGLLGLGFAIIAALVLVAAWVILAGSRFIQGGVVERPERVPQLYGYTVCLMALIWALVSFKTLVENAIALSAPELRTGEAYMWEPSVSSFEAYRATYDRGRQFGPSPEAAKADTVPEAELRRRFEGLRTDRIHRAQFETRKSLIVTGISLLIAVGLFVFHWRWLRRIASTAAT